MDRDGWKVHELLTISTKCSTIILVTKREKRVKKLFQNPKTVPFKELDRVLKDFGFNLRQPGSGSSHHVYTRDKIQISVPFRRPFVKEVYIKRVLEFLGEEYEKES